MQPIYLTLTSTGSSPWKQTNWQITPQQIGFQVISTGGSSWFISGTLEDPTGVYPNPNSSVPTAFTIFTGSSKIYVSLGTSGVPISAYQFTLNRQSSAGAKVTFVILMSGVGWATATSSARARSMGTYASFRPRWCLESNTVG